MNKYTSLMLMFTILASGSNMYAARKKKKGNNAQNKQTAQAERYKKIAESHKAKAEARAKLFAQIAQQAPRPTTPDSWEAEVSTAEQTAMQDDDNDAPVVDLFSNDAFPALGQALADAESDSDSDTESATSSDSETMSDSESSTSSNSGTMSDSDSSTGSCQEPAAPAVASPAVAMQEDNQVSTADIKVADLPQLNNTLKAEIQKGAKLSNPEARIVDAWSWFSITGQAHEDRAFKLLRDYKTPDRKQRQDMVRKLQYAVAALHSSIQASVPATRTLHTLPTALDAQDRTVKALQDLLTLARMRDLTVDPDTLTLSNDIMKIRDELSKNLASLAVNRSKKALNKNKKARHALKNDLEKQNQDLELSDDEYEDVAIWSADYMVTDQWAPQE